MEPAPGWEANSEADRSPAEGVDLLPSSHFSDIVYRPNAAGSQLGAAPSSRLRHSVRSRRKDDRKARELQTHPQLLDGCWEDDQKIEDRQVR